MSNEVLSRREFLNLSGLSLTVPFRRVFESLLGGGNEVESPLRDWLVQITERFTATATPESPLSPKGSLVTENPENFPRLSQEFINWLVIDRKKSTAVGFMFLETQSEKVEAIRSRTSAFGFFVQEAGGKNTLYPYVIGPTDINNPEKSKVGVFAWAGNKRLPAEYVQLEAVALTGSRAEKLLPGVSIRQGFEVVVFGESNPNQPGEILPHFYYFRDTQGDQDSQPLSLTFITPNGKDAVAITIPEGSAKLASLWETEAAATPEGMDSLDCRGLIWEDCQEQLYGYLAKLKAQNPDYVRSASFRYPFPFEFHPSYNPEYNIVWDYDYYQDVKYIKPIRVFWDWPDGKRFQDIFIFKSKNSLIPTISLDFFTGGSGRVHILPAEVGKANQISAENLAEVLKPGIIVERMMLLAGGFDQTSLGPFISQLESPKPEISPLRLVFAVVEDTYVLK